MSRGFLIFAHNNEQLDYGLIALINALMIKRNLVENAVALVSDRGTVDWLRRNHPDLFDRAFDHVIMLDYDRVHTTNKRRFNDTPHANHQLSWRNGTRSDAYSLTPFEETILIDADCLVQDRSLDLVWDLGVDIAMNHKAKSLEHKLPHVAEQFLSPFSIPLYWATCMYFRKSETAADFFTLVENVKTNYTFNRLVFGFPGALYRNDYAFSIAAHLMSGQVGQNIIDALPCETLLTSFDRDDIHEVSHNEIVFLVNDPEQDWRFRLSRVSGLNVHIMNKFAIVRHAETFLSLYGGST
jgi:hypothetical protein